MIFLDRLSIIYGILDNRLRMVREPSFFLHGPHLPMPVLVSKWIQYEVLSRRWFGKSSC